MVYLEEFIKDGDALVKQKNPAQCILGGICVSSLVALTRENQFGGYSAVSDNGYGLACKGGVS
jgi:hypothetical protein